MTNVLGVIVSGRLVQTDFTPISDTQFLTTILDVNSINHIVVFLTGAVPLPEGTVGMVYFSWPDPIAPPNWQLLGHISNSKPSAIFKISNLKKLDEMETRAPVQVNGDMDGFPSIHTLLLLDPDGRSPAETVGDHMYSGTFGQQKICDNGQIGVAIEPEINAQLQSPAVTTTNSYVTFAQKMLENLVNYVASFAVTQQHMTPNPGVSYIPLNTLHTWYQNFERRLQQNPNFWKS